MIENLTSPDLLPAMNANMAAFWASYGRVVGGSLHLTPHLVWFYSGVPVPLFNGVVLARTTEAEVCATIASLQTCIEERGAPALWWIGPGSAPANIAALLLQGGLQPAGETPGMAIDLARLTEGPGPAANFAIQKVDDIEKQVLWARVASAGSGFPSAVTRALVDLETGLPEPRFLFQHCYIGYLDGEPVAASTMLLDSGVAGIYAVATLPQARRRGIGRQMTAAPLLEARQAGYRVGILQASSMGYPVYRQMGFQDVCKYAVYLQSPGR
jgi:GNAT superfamily N-acetyltransferase